MHNTRNCPHSQCWSPVTPLMHQPLVACLRPLHLESLQFKIRIYKMHLLPHHWWTLQKMMNPPWIFQVCLDSESIIPPPILILKTVTLPLVPQCMPPQKCFTILCSIVATTCLQACHCAHAGPLQCSHKKCLGCAFNLKHCGPLLCPPGNLLTPFKTPQRMLPIVHKSTNLLGNPHWPRVHNCTPHPSTSTTIVDVDNKTELIDGTTLDHDSVIVEPMDQTAAAAKAANATKCF